MKMRNNNAGRYALALLATGAALALGKVLRPLVGDASSYLTLYAAVVFSAWRWGRGPSLLTALCGSLLLRRLITSQAREGSG